MLARLDREGAIEVSLLPDEGEERMCGVARGDDFWVRAHLAADCSHTWGGKFWAALVRSMSGHAI
eukprot:15454591-Alexandrium_andersonii.AAC.1